VAITTSNASWQRAIVILSSVMVAAVVLVAVYWAQSIFIPIAMGVYLTFLLNPLVRALERLRLGRVPSVLLSVILLAIVLGAVGWVVTKQVAGLVDEMPRYTTLFKKRMEYLRASARWIERTVRDINDEVTPKPDKIEGDAKDDSAEAKRTDEKVPGPEKPKTVAVQPESVPWVARLPSFLGSVAESLAAFALAIVLVLFMLIKREDLRNRLIWLMGHGRLTVTTKALDDAGQRISRFLAMQLIVNGTFGLCLGVGLFFIGLDYAILWGFLAAMLRYLPYVGTWIAAILPISLSLGMFDGWVAPALVIGLFVVIELICSNVVEPRVFGRTMGVSEVALLVTAAFWAFLWGPIGLLLSNPLTVCLVVLGKHVPQLEVFNVLLGDEPVLDPDVSFYQRLLARDLDEASQRVQAHAQATSPERVYDDLLIPALTAMNRDRESDELSESDEQFILRATQEMVEDLEDVPAAPAESIKDESSEKKDAFPLPKVRILGLPSAQEADRLALEMLRQMLDPAKWEMEICGVEMLAAELVALVTEKQPSLICIGSLPPGRLAHCRYLCKRLRSRVPETRIVVGRWGLKQGKEKNRERLREAGADEVDVTLLETRDHLHAWLPVFSQEMGPATSDGVDHAAMQTA
jgi:predicted PurR-regulated permease PerM